MGLMDEDVAIRIGLDLDHLASTVKRGEEILEDMGKGLGGEDKDMMGRVEKSAAGLKGILTDVLKLSDQIGRNFGSVLSTFEKTREQAERTTRATREQDGLAEKAGRR